MGGGGEGGQGEKAAILRGHLLLEIMAWGVGTISGEGTYKSMDAYSRK